MASPSSGNRARMDQIVGQIMAKGLAYRARRQGGSRAAGRRGRGGSGRESEGPAARWFNLG